MIMTRFLLFSDPHISSKAEFSSPTEDGLTEYLQRIVKSFSWICGLVTAEKPDVVAMLGDLFDTTGFVDTLSLHIGAKCCRMLSSTCERNEVPLYWLVGNHDIYSKNSHNLKFLGLDQWSTVIDRTQIIVNDHPFVFVPWNGEPLENANVQGKPCNIYLTHREIKGGKLNEKMRSEHGLDPNFGPWIFNGHYHIPDRVGRCYQIGSLLSKDFRDGYSSDRGAVFVTYDGLGCRVERLKNPYEVSYRVIEILSPHEAIKWSAEIDEGTSGLDKCYVKVVYDELYKEEAEKVNLVALATKMDLRTCVGPRVEEDLVNESFSPEENFTQYVESVLIFDEDSDKEAVKKKGLCYIDSVKKDSKAFTKPIQFLRLQAKGFQSLGEINVNLDNQGLVWVGGSNGSGKTTILESLFWALTGKSLRFGDRAGDDVIGWDSDGGCLVEVDLIVGGIEYKIKRGRGPNIVMIERDGTDISARRARDTERLIEGLIGRSKEVLQHSIFLTSDLETRFTSLSYPSRIRLLEDVTEAGIYSSVEDLIRKDFKKLNDDIAFSNGSKSTIESRIFELNQRLKEVNGEIAEALKGQKVDISRFEAQIHELECSVESCNRDLESIIAESEDSYHNLGLLLISNNNLVSRHDALKDKVTSIYSDINSCERDLREKRDLSEVDRCPLCLSSNVKKSLSPYIAKLQSLVNSKKVEVKLLENKLDKYRAAKKAKAEIIQNLTDRREKLELDRRCKLEEIHRCERSIDSIRALINKTESSISSLEGKREEINGSLESEEKLLEYNKVVHESFLLEERILGVLAKAFSTNGIRAMMLSAVTIPFLNSKIKEYSDILGMSFGLTTKVKAKSGSEDNKIDVLLPGHRTYKSCSRGERRRIDLAVQCAINDLAIATGGSRVNLLVADEVIDPLDDAGVESFVEVLKKKAHDATVVLITHKPFLDSYTEKRWLITKEYEITNLKVV